MAKKSFREDIKEINKMSKNIPTLMETLNFNPEVELEMCEDDEYAEEPEMQEEPMPMNPSFEMGGQGKELVKQIWKMALDGMSKLADYTDDPCYDVLKRVWQICDKVMSEKKNVQPTNEQ